MFLKKKCEEKGYEFAVLESLQFPLAKKFKKFHKKDIAYTEIDFIQLKPHKKN